ncbi:hypothetical protein F511_33264 [Dorcoceras hygrometricum]|uniref:Uncharacterized protein n=1 Tax=Dorcoceras hygrometricum TaxID=472368 RepID=A0A2Z7BN82_9LAMI|nr:hypothetical protein F511_33264 [Dorcoceras hygrometricum]
MDSPRRIGRKQFSGKEGGGGGGGGAHGGGLREERGGGITDSACKNQLVVVSVQYGPFNPYIPIRSTTIGKSRVAIDPIAMRTSWRSYSDIASVTRVSMTFRVVRTNQYNIDLGLIHSTNGNHLESPKEGSSIDHQVTIYLHAQNITMFPTNETCQSADGNHRSVIIGARQLSHLGGRHSNPIVTTPMIALDFSGTTHQSASHNVAPNQDSTQDLPSYAGETHGKDFSKSFEHQQLRASTPALIQGSKWVEIERAKLGESNATKIVKNRGWKRRVSAVESYGEQ